MEKSIPNTRIGFTLIEIMVAIGIVSILAAVVLVSMDSFGAKGRSARALAQAVSVIPPMVGCWGNGGDTNSSGNICSLGSGYGTWPTMPGDYVYSGNGITKANSSPWSFTVSSTGDSVTICCNSTMKSCGILASGGCAADTTW